MMRHLLKRLILVLVWESTGTGSIKGASDMVLADDNFATIIVRWLKKDVRSSPISKNQFSTCYSPTWLKFSPSSLQLSLVGMCFNPFICSGLILVTDTLPAIALGVEPAEPGVMTHKPRGRKSASSQVVLWDPLSHQGILQPFFVLGVYGWQFSFPEHATRTEII